eukprot:TRINITY_DN5965_c0_g1_i1.p1 TRINITY_DN5965_c0_g1~~TRINITY_DN5965_c0_g1_i1.p1  ORF type:complete len:607 (+),score=68.02 TRINITY_DN5965_c0_g1_i1:124-1944(+)
MQLPDSASVMIGVVGYVLFMVLSSALKARKLPASADVSTVRPTGEPEEETQPSRGIGAVPSGALCRDFARSRVLPLLAGAVVAILVFGACVCAYYDYLPLTLVAPLVAQSHVGKEQSLEASRLPTQLAPVESVHFVESPSRPGSAPSFESGIANVADSGLGVGTRPTSVRGVDNELALVNAASQDRLYTLPLYRQVIPIDKVGRKQRHKSGYWGLISVGTPAVAFRAVFDTGSGHVVLPSAYCHTKTCKKHRRYRRGSSLSARDIDADGTEVGPDESRDQLEVEFGTGTVEAVFLEEVICPGDSAAVAAAAQFEKLGRSAPGTKNSTFGLSVSDVVKSEGCSTMHFLAATHMSEEPFGEFSFDGILGLGLDSLSQSPRFNFVSTMKDNFGGRPIFAIHLAAHDHEESELTLGGWRPSRVPTGDVFWNPVVSPGEGHWLVRVKSVRVDDTELDICKDGSCKAVADTGTSLLAVPKQSFRELFDLLKYTPTSKQCHGPGPRLHIELENVVLTLEPSDLMHLSDETAVMGDVMAARGSAIVGSSPKDSDGSTSLCKPMIMKIQLPPPLGPKLFILGEPVLRRYYSVYDAGAKRLGFARASSPQVGVPTV